MISDIFLRAAVSPTVLPAPTMVQPLPGIITVLRRPSPSGAPIATPAEAVTPMKKVDYTGGLPTGNRVIEAVGMPPVQAHTYATNPRKDGSTHVISEADVGSASNVSSMRSAQLQALIDRNYARAHTTGNDTGKSASGVAIAAATSTDTGGAGAFHWTALIVLAGIAYLVLKR